MSLTRSLSEFAAGPVDIPETAAQVMRLSMLDWIAVGRAGVEEPVARITRDMALAEEGAAQAHVFGTGQKLPMRAAALVNGAASHALDYDDTHFAHIGHPSVAVLPAALAVAEQMGTSGSALQEAALIGVEASVRIGLWLGRAHYQIGYHQTATAGAFGAGIAAARLLGLAPDQIAHVIGLTATRAAGLKAQFGTMGKPYNAGIAAASGVEAALLVHAGFQSNPDALDGPLGFGETHHGVADVGAALHGLGQNWLFETVSHKFHACCHGLHACLEAAADLNVAPDQIDRIDVTTHPRWMTVCNQIAPVTGLGAKFSYCTVLAMHFMGLDTARLDSYSDEICADPAIKALRSRVHVTADQGISESGSQVRVTLKDGQSHSATHDLDAPQTLAARTARVQAKAASLLGTPLAGEVWQALQNKEGPDKIGAFIAQ